MRHSKAREQLVQAAAHNLEKLYERMGNVSKIEHTIEPYDSMETYTLGSKLVRIPLNADEDVRTKAIRMLIDYKYEKEVQRAIQRFKSLTQY